MKITIIYVFDARNLTSEETFKKLTLINYRYQTKLFKYGVFLFLLLIFSKITSIHFYKICMVDKNKIKTFLICEVIP